MYVSTNAPFKKGKTLYEGSVPSSGADYTVIGSEYHYTDSTTGIPGVIRAVKNTSGITLYGKQPVRLSDDGTKVLGYQVSSIEEWAVLDDDLDSNGVVANDVCYVVVQGCPLVKTAPSSLFAIAARDRIVAHTQANSTGAGTTAAGVNLVLAIANATDATGANTYNRGVMAKALTAATTNNTKTDIRIRIHARLV
jgi:hypothetical protein